MPSHLLGTTAVQRATAALQSNLQNPSSPKTVSELFLSLWWMEVVFAVRITPSDHHFLVLWEAVLFLLAWKVIRWRAWTLGWAGSDDEWDVQLKNGQTLELMEQQLLFPFFLSFCWDTWGFLGVTVQWDLAAGIKDRRRSDDVGLRWFYPACFSCLMPTWGFC